MNATPNFKFRVPLGISRETNLDISIVSNTNYKSDRYWFVCVEGKTFTAVDRTLPYFGTLKEITTALIKALEITPYDND